MNEIKLQTIENLVRCLNYTMYKLTLLNNNIKLLYLAKQNTEHNYKNEKNPLDKYYQIKDSVWLTKDWILKNYHGNFFPQLYMFINSTTTEFNNVDNYEQLVNFDTIDKYRYVNFGSNKLEINFDSIRHFVENNLQNDISLVVRWLENFITNDIDQNIDQWEINDHETAEFDVDEVNKIETLWDFNFKSFSDTIIGFGLIYQRRCQEIIMQLEKNKLEIENGREFLLSKTASLFVAMNFEKQAQLITDQEKKVQKFKQKSLAFMEQILLLKNQDVILIKEKVTDEISQNVKKFNNQQYCANRKIAEAFSDMYNNLKMNTLVDCPGKTKNLLYKDMKDRLELKLRFNIEYSKMELSKIEINEEPFNFLSLKFAKFNNITDNYNFFYFKINYLYESTSNFFAEFNKTKLNNFRKFKIKISELNKTSGHENFENDIDVNMLPEGISEYFPDAKNTKQNTYYPLDPISINDLELISNAGLEQVISPTAEEEIRKNIDEINQSYGNIILNYQSLEISNLITKSKFFHHFKRKIINLKINVSNINEILITSWKKWFETYLKNKIGFNQFAIILTNELIKQIINQQVVISIINNNIKNFENWLEIYFKDQTNQFYMITDEDFQISQFSNSLLLIEKWQDNAKIFNELIKLDQITTSLELHSSSHAREMVMWDENRGIINFCDDSKLTNKKLQTKFLISFISSKTIYILEKWKIHYLEDLNQFYGTIVNLLYEIKNDINEISYVKAHVRKEDESIPNYVINRLQIIFDRVKKKLVK